MPYQFRANVIGQIIELRLGDFGGRQLLINSELKSHRPFAGWSRASEHLRLPDPTGKLRNVEVQVRSGGTFRLRYEMVITVDGHLLAVVAPASGKERPSRCRHCTYDLRGLEPRDGEVRCPECGRHSDAAGLDLAQQPPPA